MQRPSIVLRWLTALIAACSVTLAALAQDTPGERADAAISRSVRSAILGIAVLHAMPIRVETRRGIVHLTGFVNSFADIEHADRIVRAVEGVAAVRNDLRIANRPTRA